MLDGLSFDFADFDGLSHSFKLNTAHDANQWSEMCDQIDPRYTFRQRNGVDGVPQGLHDYGHI